MNPPTQTGAAPSKPKRGITSPSRRGGSGRVLTDVLVDLGFVERAVMDDAIEKAHSAGSAAERVLLTQGAITDDQLARAVAERFGLDHVALRNYKVDPDAAKLVTPGGRQALPGRAGVVRLRTHAARRDGGSRQRARGRRHRGHDRLRGAPGGRLRRGHRVAARAPGGPRVRRRAARPRRGRGRPRPVGGRAAAEHRPALRHARPGRADRLRLRRRGRVGHPARAPHHQGGGRPRRLRHPLRAAGRRHARPLPHRRRAARRGDHPGELRAGGHLAREDHLRPRHRRAPRSRRTAASRSSSTRSTSTSAWRRCPPPSARTS